MWRGVIQRTDTLAHFGDYGEATQHKNGDEHREQGKFNPYDEKSFRMSHELDLDSRLKSGLMIPPMQNIAKLKQNDISDH